MPRFTKNKFVFIANHILEEYDCNDITCNDMAQNKAIQILTNDFQANINITLVSIEEKGWKVFFDASQELMDKSIHNQGNNFKGYIVKGGIFIFYDEWKFTDKHDVSSNSTKEDD